MAAIQNNVQDTYFFSNKGKTLILDKVGHSLDLNTNFISNIFIILFSIRYS